MFKDLDLENNKEFQKLKFAAPGPKMYDTKQIKTEPGMFQVPCLGTNISFLVLCTFVHCEEAIVCVSENLLSNAETLMFLMYKSRSYCLRCK